MGFQLVPKLVTANDL